MTATKTGVGVLDKGVAILDAVEFEPKTASELAEELGMTLSTCYRLAMALTAHDLLRRSADGIFHIGPRFGTQVLVELGGPVLASLSSETGETAQLWVRRGEVRVCAATFDSPQELRATVPVGTQLALSEGGSVAKVFQLDGAAGSTEQAAWQESVSQRTLGLCSVSAPVTIRGAVAAAVCLSAPVVRVDAEGPGAQYGARVLDAARQIATAYVKTMRV